MDGLKQITDNFLPMSVKHKVRLITKRKLEGKLIASINFVM